jgi:hypothetical protein
LVKLASCPRDPSPADLADEDDYAAWLEARRAMERCKLRSTPDGPRRDLPLDLAKAGLRLALRLCGLWQRGLANGLDICYRTVELSLARLPREFDGYRILHISDLHLDTAEGLGEAIVRTVAGAEVDLCVLTGDYRNLERGPFTVRFAVPCGAPAPGVSWSATLRIATTEGRFDVPILGQPYPCTTSEG